MKKKEHKTIFLVTLILSAFFFLVFSKDKTFTDFIESFLTSAVYAYTLSYGNYFVTSYLNKHYPWVESTKKRAIVSIIAILIFNIIAVYFCNYMNYVVIQKAITAEKFFSSDDMNFINWFYINIALLISAFLHAKSFMEELKQTSKKEIVEQTFIANSANAQFETLKNQLDPHFLFNSLNVLSSLIEEDPKMAVKFTNSMSKVYRYVLEQKDKEVVTVEDEVDFAKTYCNLLKMRFEDSVHFNFEVSDDIKNQFVVPLSLQLLLENCIKHNFATSSKPLNISIFTENGRLCVQNNLQVREQLNDKAGIGLTNIVQRYSLITKNNVSIEQSEDYFKVKLPILIQKPEIMNIVEKNKDHAYETAKKRVKEIKDFYSFLITYLLSIPFLIAINYLTTPDYRWCYFPILAGAVGTIIQAVNVFVINKNWEEKKIDKLMKNNKQ